MLEVLLLSDISVMVGDRYRKRAKSRKRDFEREKHEWSDNDSDLEEENFVSQRKMRKASKEDGGKKKVQKKKQTFGNPKCGSNKKKKAMRNVEKMNHSRSHQATSRRYMQIVVGIFSTYSHYIPDNSDISNMNVYA